MFQHFSNVDLATRKCPLGKITKHSDVPNIPFKYHGNSSEQKRQLIYLILNICDLLMTFYNLKTMLDVLCGWKLQTLIQLSGGIAIQWHWKICFWCDFFGCVLLFYRLWRKELGELVFVMEGNPCCSMKTLLKLCGSRFYKEIDKKISTQWKDEVLRNIFYVGWRRKTGFFGDEEKLSG